tara:strand:+ start:2464 stop:3111 length:648 start_codon:yes stop_codon:yes gene_type:complete
MSLVQGVPPSPIVVQQTWGNAVSNAILNAKKMKHEKDMFTQELEFNKDKFNRQQDFAEDKFATQMDFQEKDQASRLAHQDNVIKMQERDIKDRIVEDTKREHMEDLQNVLSSEIQTEFLPHEEKYERYKSLGWAPWDLLEAWQTEDKYKQPYQPKSLTELGQLYNTSQGINKDTPLPGYLMEALAHGMGGGDYYDAGKQADIPLKYMIQQLMGGQ